MENRVFGGKGDLRFWSDKPIQKGHPNFKHNEETFRKEFKIGDEIALPNWGGHKLKLVDIGSIYIIVEIQDEFMNEPELGHREIACDWIHV